MVNIRKFCISGGIFSGFETLVDLDKVESIQDIIFSVIDNLKVFLCKMYSLSEMIDPLVYHIHDYTFEHILLSNPDEIFYVCNHC